MKVQCLQACCLSGKRRLQGAQAKAAVRLNGCTGIALCQSCCDLVIRNGRTYVILAESAHVPLSLGVTPTAERGGRGGGGAVGPCRCLPADL